MCGNFGIILLQKASSERVARILKKMMQVTMMRGAQSAGLATYQHRWSSNYGARMRVVNGKRSELDALLLGRCRGLLRNPAVGQIFQGHTRFATSSISNLAGCHPHQWCAAARDACWEDDASRSNWRRSKRNVEGFITHNGTAE